MFVVQAVPRRCNNLGHFSETRAWILTLDIGLSITKEQSVGGNGSIILQEPEQPFFVKPGSKSVKLWNKIHQELSESSSAHHPHKTIVHIRRQLT